MVEASSESLTTPSSSVRARRLGVRPRIDRRRLPASVVEQVNRRLYHSAWPMINTSVSALMMAAVAFRVGPMPAVATWLVVTVGFSVGRYIAYRVYRAMPPGRRADACWSDMFVRLMLAHGLCFGAAGLVMLLTGDVLTHLTVIMTVLGLGAGVAAIYAADLRVVTGFIAGAFVPVVLCALVQADTLHVVAALLMTMLGGNLVVVARNVNHSLIHTLILRHDKEELAQALIAEKSRTELASRAKSDFLATMSHELRTPLNAIIGFSELMLTQTFGPLGAPRYVEYCGDIHSSAAHLLSLINDILDSAKVEAGKYELQEAPTDLRRVIEASARLMRERAAQKGVGFRVSVDPLPPILADERALRQILLNLLSNAIKFTPAGGSVTLSAIFAESAAVLIEVRDTGIGIPPEDLANVLNHFARASNAHLSGETGTGLGLPIVRGLVALHGGELRIASTPGSGTVVTVELPASRILAGA